MFTLLHVAVLLAYFPYATPSWQAEELALYDLVEEVHNNFYDIYGISKDASVAEIKRAYRKLSLEWHPDRNSAPDASDKFRQIAAIYEVLKSAELREKYNNVLEYGLPDWRQPVFYYRKMRKLSWYEALLVLIGVSSIAHYLMMWAAYYEKYLVLSQSIKKSRKREKKSEPDVSATQLREALEIYRPQIYNLLPFLIVKGSWSTFMFLIAVAKEYMTRREVPDEEEIVEARKPSTTPRAPAPVFNYEVATDLKPVSTNNPESYAKYMSEQLESNKSRYLLVSTYKVDTWLGSLLSLWILFGTPNRWECMARVLNRSAQDIVTMAGKLKHMKQRSGFDSVIFILFWEEYAKLAAGQQSSSVSSSVMDVHNIKQTDSPNKAILTTEWSQLEQKQLETALQQYPKGCEDRWDKIASAVPTKSKEQCQQRLKELVELVRRKKANVKNKE
ncbi:unnamed protein product [Haemonchus placei]|uniref:DnaJ homolog subfamily C member 2 n=1 Tax=Haemonchus placei TaxID=6290 RepID=A0A158QM72_HAEPC|nr:unnamed protein product [Haemonchus placei]